MPRESGGRHGEGEIIATLEGDKVEVRFGDQTKRLVRSVLEVLEP